MDLNLWVAGVDYGNKLLRIQVRQRLIQQQSSADAFLN
jgi:hypothetical protein